VLLRTLGAMREGGTNVLSYLLTDGRYCRSLMRQGYRDAIARRHEISAFLGQRERSPVRKKVRKTLIRRLLPELGASSRAVSVPATPAL
jgi:hypothetical protein